MTAFMLCPWKVADEISERFNLDVTYTTDRHSWTI